MCRDGSPGPSPVIASLLTAGEEVHEVLSPPVLGQPWTKRVPQERERRDLMIVTPVDVPAVDDARLVRMQFQTDRRQPLREASPNLTGLLLACAVDHRIIAVAFEGDRRELPDQPHVERVVQIQIRQHG